jgi:hypothetical protein
MRSPVGVLSATVLVGVAFGMGGGVSAAPEESAVRGVAGPGGGLLNAGHGLGRSIYTLAGGGRRPARPGVLAADVDIHPYSIAATPSGGLVFSDAGRVFGLGRGGRVHLIADGLGRADDLAVGPDGSVYVLDTSYSTVQRVTPDGRILTAAGQPHPGADADAGGDGGPGDQARLCQPTGIDVQHDGGLLIADQCNNRVRRVAPDGIINTVAGTGTQSGAGDNGPARLASTFVPADVAASLDGGFFVSDRAGPDLSRGWRIRHVAANGIITTLVDIGADPARLAALSDGAVAFKLGQPPFVASQIHSVSLDGRAGVLVDGRSHQTLLDGDTTDPNRTRFEILNLASDRDGGLLFRDGGERVRYLPPRNPGRLAVGIAERSISARGPGSLRIGVTRAASVRVSEFADGRPVWEITRKLRPGTTTIRVRGRDAIGVRVFQAVATDDTTTTSDRLALVLGPDLPTAIARRTVNAAYRDEPLERAAACRRRSPNRVDCAVETKGGGPCQRTETVSRVHYGELRIRSYDSGHDVHCHFHTHPRYSRAPRPIAVPG